MFSRAGEHLENMEIAKTILNLSTEEVQYMTTSLHGLQPETMCRRKQIHNRGLDIVYKYFQPNIPLFVGSPVLTNDKWLRCPQPFDSHVLYPYQKKAVTGMILSECLATNHAFVGKCDYAPQYEACISMRGNINETSYSAVGGLLNMDVGTGKTVTSLALIRLTLQSCTDWMSMGENRAGTLILAPPQLVRQWKNEIKKFCPSLRLSYQYGTKSIGVNNFPIILSSYKTFQQRWDKFSNTEFFRIILDEGHLLNYRSATTCVCASIISLRRWVITATPLAGTLDSLIPYYYLLKIVSETFSNRDTGGCIDKGWLQLSHSEGDSDLVINSIYDPRASIDILARCQYSECLYNTYKCFAYSNTRVRPHSYEIRDSIRCCATLGALCSIFLEFSSEGSIASSITVLEQSYMVSLPRDYLLFLNKMREQYYWDNKKIITLIRMSLSIVASEETFKEAADEYTKRARSEQLENLSTVEYTEFMEDTFYPNRCKQNVQYAVTEGTDCCICMEPLEELTLTLPCFHLFCQKCALHWSRIRVTCPVCRAKLQSLKSIQTNTVDNASQNITAPPPQADILLTPRVISAMDYIRTLNADTNILVFVEFPIVGRAIANILSNDYSVGIITGSTKMHAKHKILEQFQQGKLHILILTFTVSGVGLNITKANHIVMVEPPETVQIKKQAIGRAVREGQERDVTVANFYCDKTFETRYPLNTTSNMLPRRIFYG
jgi:SNF2 family DNA or RNA helicase